MRRNLTRYGGGPWMKRLKGFEPSTFCMASRRSSQLSYSRAESEFSAGLAAQASPNWSSDSSNQARVPPAPVSWRPQSSARWSTSIRP